MMIIRLLAHSSCELQLRSINNLKKVGKPIQIPSPILELIIEKLTNQVKMYDTTM